MKTLKLFQSAILMPVLSVVLLQSCSEEMAPELQLNREAIETLQTKSMDTQTPEFAPLGVVPDWAKAKMTDEEVEMWETISTVYHIDYSFLNRKNINRQGVYETARMMKTEIDKGEFDEGVEYYYSVSTSGSLTDKIERLGYTEIGKSTYGPVTLYSSYQTNIKLMGTFWYTRDTDKVLEVGGANAYPSKSNATFNGTETVSKYGQYAAKFSVAGSIMYYNITENLNVSHVYDLINYN